jgi:hypothetical protein
MVMQKPKQFTLQINDDPGLLAEITSALWDRGVNILGFAADVHGRKGTVHLLVDKAPLAKKTFAENGWSADPVNIPARFPHFWGYH